MLPVYDKYTGEKIAEIHRDSREDLKEKIDLAYNAKDKVANLTIDEKLEMVREYGKLLRRHKNEFINLLVREAGEPRKYAERFEFRSSFLYTQFFDAHLDLVAPQETDAMSGKNYFEYVPLGIVAVISPRNGPLILSNLALLSSFGAGNATILKPSSKTPLTGLKLIELASQVFPENSAIFTSASGPDASQEFIENEKVMGLVFYTNSHVGKELLVRYGRHLDTCKINFAGGFMYAGRFLKYVPELAGNDAYIVLPSADLEKAAEGAVIGGFSNAGQMCISAKRIIVSKEIDKEFRELMIEKTLKLKVGDPNDPQTDIGPIGTKRTLDLSELQLKDALRKGGKTIVGGKREDPFYYPTLVELNGKKILETKKWELKPFLWIEECFAPIRSYVVYDTIEEAIALANDCRYALRCTIIGEEREARPIASKVDAGMVTINENPLYADVFIPFGGYKDSGYGGAKFLIQELVNRKVIHIGRFED